MRVGVPLGTDPQIAEHGALFVRGQGLKVPLEEPVHTPLAAPRVPVVVRFKEGKEGTAQSAAPARPLIQEEVAVHLALAYHLLSDVEHLPQLVLGQAGMQAELPKPARHGEFR